MPMTFSCTRTDSVPVSTSTTSMLIGEPTPSGAKSETIPSFFNDHLWYQLAPTCRLCSGTLPRLWLPPAGPRWCQSPPPPGSVEPAGGWSDLSHNPNPQPEHVAVPSADIWVNLSLSFYLATESTMCIINMFGYDILYLLVQVSNNNVLHLAWRWETVLVVESSVIPFLKQPVRHGGLCFNRNFSYKTSFHFDSPVWLSQSAQIKYTHTCNAASRLPECIYIYNKQKKAIVQKN